MSAHIPKTNAVSDLHFFRKGKIQAVRDLIEAVAGNLPIEIRKEFRKAFYPINNAERMLDQMCLPAEGPAKPE